MLLPRYDIGPRPHRTIDTRGNVESPATLLHHRPGNRVLARLTERELSEVAPLLEHRSVNRGEVLHEPYTTYQQVHFPDDALIALQTVVDGGRPVGTTVVGSNGFVGVPLLLGSVMPVDRAVALTRGNIVSMSRDSFLTVTGRFRSLDGTLQRFACAQHNHLSLLSACARRHSVAQRVACELLLLTDHAGSLDLPLTHETLAQLVGVRRASITVVAEALRDRGAIRYTRGRIAVVDQNLLALAACPCYVKMKRCYARAANDQLQ